MSPRGPPWWPFLHFEFSLGRRECKICWLSIRKWVLTRKGLLRILHLVCDFTIAFYAQRVKEREISNFVPRKLWHFHIGKIEVIRSSSLFLEIESLFNGRAGIKWVFDYVNTQQKATHLWSFQLYQSFKLGKLPEAVEFLFYFIKLARKWCIWALRRYMGNINH